MSDGVARIILRGAFSVLSPAGAEIAPAGQKERALIAMLALAPSCKKSRKWLQAHLWSGRFDDQAAASLRRAICNIRKSAPEYAALLKSDRSSVWLAEGIEVDLQNGLRQQSGLLEDIAVKDPEYLSWLAGQRARVDGPAAPGAAADALAPVLKIVCFVPQQNHEARFLGSYLSETLASQLKSLGDIGIDFVTGCEEESAPARNLLFVVNVESAVTNGAWFSHMRVTALHPRRFLWSGRLRLPMDMQKIFDGPEVAEFISRAISSLVQKTAQAPGLPPYFSVQQAAMKIFSGSRLALSEADSRLAAVQSRDTSGVAAAWRAYVKLTEALEFGEFSDATRDEAAALAEYALGHSGRNALVPALASQIQMKICGDADYGSYLAHQSLGHCDQNPYALHSLSQARVFQGRYREACQLAQWAREAAGPLPNAFCWDMQCCLTALCEGQIEQAVAYARDAHLKMPAYRPALRYLVALNALLGRGEEMRKYEDRLRGAEPGFEAAHLLLPSYPLETLRMLGLTASLAERLQAPA